jgi:hypothetical protein
MSAETARAVLNVGARATRSEVDQAFRAQARLCHPDRFAGSSAAELTAASAQFVRVCDARDALHRTVAAATAGPLPGSAPSAPAQSQKSAPATPPMASARSHSPASSSPLPETLSFADFVRVKDAAAWMHDRPPEPKPRRSHARRARTPQKRRTSDAFRVALLVLALVAVGGVISAYLTTDAPPASTATVAAAPQLAPPLTAPPPLDLLTAATVLQADAATYESTCRGDEGCWIWSVTTRADCPVATITVNFSDSATGATTRSSTSQVAVIAETPLTLVEPGRGGAPEFAGIQSITC